MEALSNFEFLPEDFKGVVVLPLNEAKNVLEAYKILANVYSAMYVSEGADVCKNSIKALEARINKVGV